ncbi:hypothetical protein P8C59_007803 [Phyllachora maydis]|uniref:TAFII55 protein conserved region domain-containing protein n=1 Tax=Phyllachora maydis TaxID=1825666 RepID=A0AAD9IAY5_9PEZI|nr:hypothetical protein P8C59_007803 [Phyllachora maydis]
MPKLNTSMGPPPPPLPPPLLDDGILVLKELPQKILKTKTGRVMKPTAKKRAKNDADSDDEISLAQAKTAGPQPKRIKVVPPPRPPPQIKVKKKRGNLPHRPLGDGYDSEAEDREVDPVMVDQLVLRIMPGEHLDYVRKMVEEAKERRDKRGAQPIPLGGMDVTMKFFEEDSRRAMVTILGQPFAAVLLDLPTVTESMKTWDKKNMVKSADICQMLLVFAKVKGEEEAKMAPLPRTVEPGFRWPHGLTPPMHDCRNRRFRKRLSKLEIQNKEAEVERLLAADKNAISTTVEWVDEADAEAGVIYEDEMEDAEGDPDDYFGDGEADQQLLQPGEEDAPFDDINDADLEAEFDAAPDTPADALMLSLMSAVDVPTPNTANTATPAPHTEESTAEVEADGAEDESGGEEEEDEEDEEEDDEMDEGGVEGDGDDENRAQVASIRAEIATLKKQLAKFQDDLAKSQSHILRKRIEGQIKNIKAELDLKKSSIGEADDD